MLGAPWRDGAGSGEISNYVGGDALHEECGVFGAHCPRGVAAANLAYLGLYALQHRGQESAGIVASDGAVVRMHKDMGLVPEVFSERSLAELPGHIAIGHVRYSTTGQSSIMNAQPLLARCSKGTVALAHNGNLVNADELRQILEENGSVFQTTTDTEVIINLIARFAWEDLEGAITQTVKLLRGSYALVVMTRDRLIALRDPLGIRPMCLGEIDGGYVVASESCALANLGARNIREVEPGEMVVVDETGLRSKRVAPVQNKALCVFEFIYFARPDSDLAGRNVHLVRRAIGRELAREAAVEADVVIAAPDSGTSAAMGFADEVGLPFEVGLIKNRYVGRTFIQPSQSLRDLGVQIKLNPIRSVLEGRRVVLIDDSVVRGTTSAKTVQLLRQAGAREVHLRVASPPYLHSCYYGIDTSAAGELIASGRSLGQIREVIGSDTLAYLSLPGLWRAVEVPSEELCLACFNGKYPVEVNAKQAGKFAFEEQGRFQFAGPR